MTGNRFAISLIAAGGLLAALLVLGTPGGAYAATLSTPAADVLDRAAFKLQMATTDATGTAVLTIDGRPMASRLATPGSLLDFGTFKLGVGAHKAQVVIRSRSGSASSTEVPVKVWGLPGKPVLVSPTPGGYAARYVTLTMKPGPSTTLVHVYVNGRFFKTTSVYPGALQNLGTMSLSTGVNTVEFRAVNPVATTKVSYKVNRLDYPWATCIIIDKSDCKLYWVKDGVLVKAYPIAVGKRSTQTPVGTWKIGAKYITGPVGIYGPRKMRMYRQTKSGFVFTAYNIHGTNQEWVIGTWASHGCIRMYNKDVLEFYPQVPMGTMVQTRE